MLCLQVSLLRRVFIWEKINAAEWRITPAVLTINCQQSWQIDYGTPHAKEGSGVFLRSTKAHPLHRFLFTDAESRTSVIAKVLWCQRFVLENVKKTNLPNLIKQPADSHEGLSSILIQKRLQRQRKKRGWSIHPQGQTKRTQRDRIFKVRTESFCAFFENSFTRTAVCNFLPSFNFLINILITSMSCSACGKERCSGMGGSDGQMRRLGQWRQSKKAGGVRHEHQMA